MSVFMVTIPSARLERQAARVEGDALAHEHDVGDVPVDVHRIGRLVGGPQQTRRLAPSPGPRRAGHRDARRRCGSRPTPRGSTPGWLATYCSAAASAKRVGVIELGGSLTRSRARHTASATARPCATPWPAHRRPRRSPTPPRRAIAPPFVVALVCREPVGAEDGPLGHGLPRRPWRTGSAHHRRQARGGRPSPDRPAARTKDADVRRSVSASTPSTGPHPTYTTERCARRRAGRAQYHRLAHAAALKPRWARRATRPVSGRGERRRLPARSDPGTPVAKTGPSSPCSTGTPTATTSASDSALFTPAVADATSTATVALTPQTPGSRRPRGACRATGSPGARLPASAPWSTAGPTGG